MATKRQRRQRHRAIVTLDAFTLADKLYLAGGWRPGVPTPRGWQSWDAFLSDYEAVREDFIAWWHRPSHRAGRPIFADCVRAAVRAGRPPEDGAADYAAWRRGR